MIAGLLRIKPFSFLYDRGFKNRVRACMIAGL